MLYLVAFCIWPDRSSLIFRFATWLYKHNRVNHWPLMTEFTFCLSRAWGGTERSMLYSCLCFCDDQLLYLSQRGPSKSHLNNINSDTGMLLSSLSLERFQGVKGLYQMLGEINYRGRRVRSCSECPLDLYLGAELNFCDILYFILEHFRQCTSYTFLPVYDSYHLENVTVVYFLNDSMRILHHLSF